MTERKTHRIDVGTSGNLVLLEIFINNGSTIFTLPRDVALDLAEAIRQNAESLPH